MLFINMSVNMLTEYPLLEDILKKHRAEGEEELGQAQFAESLQPVLQDLADALAEKNVIVIHNIKISNGSKMRKVVFLDYFCFAHDSRELCPLFTYHCCLL